MVLFFPCFIFFQNVIFFFCLGVTFSKMQISCSFLASSFSMKCIFSVERQQVFVFERQDYIVHQWFLYNYFFLVLVVLHVLLMQSDSMEVHITKSSIGIDDINTVSSGRLASKVAVRSGWFCSCRQM